MQSLAQDIKYALRQMRLAPLFTLTILLTLTLSTGATTAIFSLMDTIMLRPLPLVIDPSTLYRVGDGLDCCLEGTPQENWGMFSYKFYSRVKEQAPEFDQLCAFSAGTEDVGIRRREGDRVARSLRAEFVSGNYFSTFGINTLTGRTILPSDDDSSAAPVALLSYQSWQNLYGSDQTLVNSSVMLDGHPFTIIGVAPKGFFGETLRADPPEIWIPIHQEPLIRGSSSVLNRFPAWLRIIGRLRPNARTEPLQDRLTGLLRFWLVNESGMPSGWMGEIEADLSKQHINVVPAAAGVGMMKAYYADSLRILFVVCGIAMLIACANVANLLLARDVGRRERISLQLALGATRARIIRQYLTESLVLAFLCAALSFGAAFVGIKLILLLAFREAQYVPIDAIPSLLDVAFSFSIALATGVLFGALPAWILSHINPVEALRSTKHGASTKTSILNKILVITQATLSLVLLVTAALLTRSLEELRNRDFGYVISHRVIVSISGPLSSYSDAKLDAIYRDLEYRFAHIAGVTRAALARYTPLQDDWGTTIVRPGHEVPKASEGAASSWDLVSPEYFSALGQSIVRGRSLAESDTQSTEHVAVVDETFVRKFFKPGEDPIGATFGLNSIEYGSTYKVVGIVRNSTYSNPASTDPPVPIFFAPLAQRVHYQDKFMQSADDRAHLIEGAVLELRGSMDGLEPQIDRALSEADRDLTLLSIKTLQEQVNSNFDQQRVIAQITELFGIFSLILAAIGLYGVTAYTVHKRIGEFGIRLALGAKRLDLIIMVLSGAFAQVVIGLLIGIPISIGCSQMISSQLFRVRGSDPLALCVSVMVLTVTAFWASIIPALRAASTNPAEVLRTD